MLDIVLENLLRVLTALLLVLLNAAGVWLSSRLGKQKQLQTIQGAVAELIEMSMLTVEELQQTAVEGLKAAGADGRLSAQEIRELNRLLVEKTKAKLSTPALALIDAAGVDVQAVILGAGEAWLQRRRPCA